MKKKPKKIPKHVTSVRYTLNDGRMLEWVPWDQMWHLWEPEKYTRPDPGYQRITSKVAEALLKEFNYAP